MGKRINLAAGLVVVILALSACENTETKTAGNTSATTNTAATTKVDEKVLVEDVKATIAKHDKALNDKNIDAVMATFSTEPTTVVLGTGEGERFVGQQAIKEAYTEILKDYDAGTLTANCDWKAGGVDDAGTTAWVAATCKASDSLKNVKRDYTLNVSGALEKQNNEWRFVMLHMSNATNATPPAGSTASSAKGAPPPPAPAK